MEIFSRINSTGTRLGPVDFMRALTWSDEFDLNQGIQDIRVAAANAGFEFEDETILKLLAVVAGRNPTAEDVLTLKSESAESLHALVKAVSENLLRSTGFLKNNCYVHSVDFLPYEGQLLAIAMFFTAGFDPLHSAEQELTRWFWTVSLNEQLRGKPDHYVARQLRSIQALAKGDDVVLYRRLTVSSNDFVERRFIKGKALSTAFVCMFAANQARSLVTGDLIASSEYLAKFDPDRFINLVSLPELSVLLGRTLPSARVFANLVLVTASDAKFISANGWNETLKKLREQAGAEEFDAILRSQFFVPGSSPADRGEDALGMLQLRSDELAKFAAQLSA